MRLLVLLVFLIPATAVADEADDKGMQLSVKPRLCVTDNRNPSCDMSLLVTWRSITTGYYCLFNDIVDGPLRCWNDDQSGQLNEDRSVTQNFSYWMTGAAFNERLTEVRVEVLRLDTDDRRRRRRARHVWDIN